ncbi:MAG: hypothetical protein IJU76_14995, partial [Desulfovibrionaceae bacterium]|nr:hypothetical protein [Desulfovibrionaceae bacterium]
CLQVRIDDAAERTLDIHLTIAETPLEYTSLTYGADIPTKHMDVHIFFELTIGLRFAKFQFASSNHRVFWKGTVLFRHIRR